MGQNSSNQSIQQQYDVVCVMKDGSAMLQDKKTNCQYLLRNICSNIQQQITCFAALLQRRQKIKCTHLLNLQQIRKREQKQVCSIVYKLYILIQYPFKSLRDQMQQRMSHGCIKGEKNGRKIHKQMFAQAQLWSILYSCCVALDAIYKSKMTHESLSSSEIFIDKGGIIKISDPLLLGLQKNYIKILKKDPKKVFVSPQIMNFLDDCNFSFFDKQKSDVFTLGMIMLEISLLSDICIYDLARKQPNLEIIQNHLASLKLHYSQSYYLSVKSMVQIVAKMRPNFNSIITQIQQENQMSDKTRYCDNNSSYNQTNSNNHIQSQYFQNSIQNSFNYNASTTIKNKPKNVLKNCQYDRLARQFSSGTKKQFMPIGEQPLNWHTASINGNSQPPSVDFNLKTLVKFPNSNLMPQQWNNTHIIGKKIMVEPKFRTEFYLSSTTNFNESHSSFRAQNTQQNTVFTNDIPEIKKILDSSKKKYNVEANVSCNHKKIEAGNNYTSQKNQQSVMTFVAPKNIKNHEILNTIHDENIKQANRQNRANMQKRGRLPIEQYPLNYPQQNIKLNSPQKSPGSLSYVEDDKILDNHRIPLTSQFIQPTNDIPGYKNNPTQIVTRNNNFKHLYEHQQQKQQAKFVNLKLNQEGQYSGYFCNNMKNGEGKLQFKDGGFYFGNWLNDQMHGYGRLHYQNGQIAYQGQWVHDQFDGQGIVYNQKPQKILGPFNYYDFADLGNKWIYYQGSFHKDCKNGKGTIKLSNGELFQGNFVYDTIQGSGIFFKNDRTVIRGNWRDNIYIESQ